jgi:hypothetical protein
MPAVVISAAIDNYNVDQTAGYCRYLHYIPEQLAQPGLRKSEWNRCFSEDCVLSVVIPLLIIAYFNCKVQSQSPLPLTLPT